MRGTFVAMLVFAAVWFALLFRGSCTDSNFKICTTICQQRGRTLSSVTPGFITECNCGDRLKVKPSLRRP